MKRIEPECPEPAPAAKRPPASAESPGDTRAGATVALRVRTRVRCGYEADVILPP